MIAWSRQNCENCIKINQNNPKMVPCVKFRGPGGDSILLVSQDVVCYTACPFTASWEEVKRAATSAGSHNQLTARELARIRPLLAKYANDPLSCGYVPGTMGTNHPHGYVLADGSKRLMVWLRKLDATHTAQFNEWFFSQGLEVPVGQMSTLQKLIASAHLAAHKLPAEGKKVIKSLIESLPVLVAVLGALALSPQKYVAFFRGLFYGFGIVTQAKDYLDSFARWLVYGGGATSYSDLDKGAEALAHFVAQAIADIGLAAVERFISFIKSKSAKELEQTAHTGGYDGTEHAKPPAHPGSRMGYAKEHLCRKVEDISHLLRKSEDSYWRERCAKEHEITVLREMDPRRKALLENLHGWAQGKAEWIKAKSWMGWHGIVGIPKSAEVLEAIGRMKRCPNNYKMGNLKGASPEIDAFIAHHPECLMYELPIGVNFKVEGVKNGKLKVLDAFDWKAGAHKPQVRPSVREGGGTVTIPGGHEADGYRLVDVGDRLIIVDRLGNPVIQDVDIGGIWKRPGKGQVSQPGAHLESGKTNPEDNAELADEINYKMSKKDGFLFGVYNVIFHGAAGGSARHTARGGAWSPKGKDGSYDHEKLFVYLPCRTLTGWKTELVAFEGYPQFIEFCHANGLGCPW
jgi:hypothetical protein